MGVFSDKMTEVAKLNKMNIDSKSAEKAEQSISEIISTIEKNDMSKANEVRKKILGIIETDISKYITASGEINVKDFVRSFDYIKKETMEMQSTEEKNVKEENIFNGDSEKKEDNNKEVEDTFDIDEEYENFGKTIEDRERNAKIDLDKASEAVDNFSKKYGEIDEDNLAVSDLPEELIQATKLENTPENEEKRRKLLYEVARKMHEDGVEFDLEGDSIEEALDGMKSSQQILKLILEADKTIVFKLIKAKGQELSIDSLKEIVKDFGMDFEEFKLIYTDEIQVEDDALFKEIFDKTIVIENLEKARAILRENPITNREELKKLLKNSSAIHGLDDETIDEIIQISNDGGIEQGIEFMIAHTHNERELGIGKAIKKNLEKYKEMLENATGKRREDIINEMERKLGFVFDKDIEIIEQVDGRINEVSEYLAEQNIIVQENATQVSNENIQYLSDVVLAARDTFNIYKTSKDIEFEEKYLKNSEKSKFGEMSQIEESFSLKNKPIFIKKNIGKILQQKKRISEKEKFKIGKQKIEEADEEIEVFEYKYDMEDFEDILGSFEKELGLTGEIEVPSEEQEKEAQFSSAIASIFPREETKKKGIDMASIALEDFGELMDAFATGDKQYILSVMLNQNMEAMQYLVKNLKHTVELGDFLEQHKFVPKEVTDRWKQMAAEGKDPFEEMRKEATKELNLEEPEVAKVEKKISGVTSVKEVMAVPKEVVLDYMEMDIKVGTDPKNATMIMAEQLKQSKVLTKFKGMKESGLSVEEYSEIMAGVIMETEQMMDDGRLPKTIVEKGQERDAGLNDFINMTFDNTEILLSNMPEKASELGKEELAKLIKEKVEEATRETVVPEVEEQENEVENLHTHENIEVEQLEEERDVNREAEREAQKAIEQKELEKRLQKEQAKELEAQERSLTDEDAKTVEEQKKLVEEEQEKQQQALVPVQKGFVANVRKIFNDVRMNVSKFFENIKDKIAGNDKQNKEEEKKEIKLEESKVDKETKEDDYIQKVNVNLKELSAQKVTVRATDEQDRGDER